MYYQLYLMEAITTLQQVYHNLANQFQFLHQVHLAPAHVIWHHMVVMRLAVVTRIAHQLPCLNGAWVKTTASMRLMISKYWNLVIASIVHSQGDWMTCKMASRCMVKILELCSVLHHQVQERLLVPLLIHSTRLKMPPHLTIQSLL